MKQTSILLSFALMAAVLFGCQPEKEAVGAEEGKNEIKVAEKARLLGESEILKVELSEVKGMNPIVYDETNELEIFRALFSSAKKEPGIVNMSDPEFYLKVATADGEKHYLNLWLGSEGETASLMNADETHTIYVVAPEMKEKLVKLIEG